MTFFRVVLIVVLCSWMAGYAFAGELPVPAGFIPLHANAADTRTLRPGSTAPHFIALPPRHGAGIPLSRMTRAQPQTALLMPSDSRPRRRAPAMSEESLPQGTPGTHDMTKAQAHQIVSIFTAAD